jgi:hypothetical protein
MTEANMVSNMFPGQFQPRRLPAPIRPTFSLALIVSALGALTAAHGEEKPMLTQLEGFVKFASGLDAQQALENARDQQLGVLNRLESWRGHGEIEERFNVGRMVNGRELGSDASDRAVLKTDTQGPEIKNDANAKTYRVRRRSKMSFLWSKKLKAFWATYHTVSPSIYENLGNRKRYAVEEKIDIEHLIRPEGFYEFFPNAQFGEFVGIPKSLKDGERTRVVERKSLQKVQELRTFSTLFDPTTLFEISTRRVDEEVTHAATRAIQESDRFLVKQHADGRLMTETHYSTGPNLKPTLTVFIILDPSANFLPASVSMIEGNGIVIDLQKWTYNRDQEFTVPARFQWTKFNQDGSFQAERTVTIQEFTLNPKVTTRDFAFSQIGVVDGDRLVDHAEKKIYFFKEGQPVLAGVPE